MGTHFLKTGYCLLALFAGLMHDIAAQEGVELRPLQVNTQLVNAKKALPKKSTKSLLLPFFDDFSSLRSPRPNDTLWQDDHVFINADFPIFPPTIGVATFDALNADGRLYDTATTSPFPADTLTSQPIRLDTIFPAGSEPQPLTKASNIYLSFYYQPGGGLGSSRGRAPAKNDKLILEFRVNDSVWNEVWKTNGQTLEEFCPLCATDTADRCKAFFKQVFVPVDSSIYMYDGFQFRFRNISTVDPRGSASGQWHLDYVYLAPFRDTNDVFSHDVAFVNRGERVLKDFHAIPITQFKGNKDTIERMRLLVRNLDTAAVTTAYVYRIFNQNGQIVDSTPALHLWKQLVYPFNSNGFDTIKRDPNQYPAYPFPIANAQTSQTFTIQHILTPENPDRSAANDTMEQTVHFGNYYAYDDGTPEMGFGFVGNYVKNSQFAYQFPLRVSDTLTAVQIWFNPTLEDMSRAYFNLSVWKGAANDGSPNSSPIDVSGRIEPIYNEKAGYVEFPLDTLIILDTGSFFIGFQQQSDAYLNIGFDQNNNALNRMFYHNVLYNEWLPVFYYGSVMMRPVFGTRGTPTGFCEKGIEAADKISIYPNPSDGTVFVESSENAVNSYELYDLSGRRLVQKMCKATQFSISLPERSGVYILLLSTDKGLVSKKVVRR